MNRILNFVPREFGTYFEPFLGGGSVFFGLGLQEKSSQISDVNADLIEFYGVVRDSPNALFETISKFETTDDAYYSIRAQDRRATFRHDFTDVERAARFLYLNKMGFNGLHRVNRQGHFNVPVGRRAKPLLPLFSLVAKAELIEMSRYLGPPASGHAPAGVTLKSGPWSEILKDVQEGDFVYLDPPYDPISKTSSFVAYHDAGFGVKDQKELRDACVILARDKKAFVLLSNSATKFVHDTFVMETEGLFRIADEFTVQRSVSANADKRVLADEVLIWNYNNRVS